MRKKLSLFMIFALLLTVFTACSGGNTSGTGEQPNTQEPAKQDEKKEKDIPTLTLMTQNHPAWPFNENWLVWDILEKGANINLKPSGITGNWWETIPLIIASGDMPDFLWISGLGMIHKYGSEGALINYLDYMDKMPNFKNFITKYPEESNYVLSHDGKMYVTPSEGAYSKLAAFFMYREDIFKKHNLALPTTYDEFYSTLKELKKLYPDSTPWAFFKDLSILNQIAISWDTGAGFYYNEAQKSFVYGPSEDAYKAMIEYMNKLYNEKLISSEFLTLDDKQRDDLISNGKAFVYHGYINNMDTFNSNVRKTNPDFTLAHMPPPKGPGGHGYHSGAQFIGSGYTVTSTTKHLDAALRMIDYAFSKEGREALSWGVEGETYVKKEGKNEFIKEKVANMTQLRQKYGLGTSGNIQWFDNNSNLALMSEEAKKAETEAVKYVGPAQLPPAFTKEESEILSLKGQAIGKYKDENISKFIVGNKPMSEWSSYVEGYKALGIDEVIKIYNTAYERAEQNKAKK